jgi:hypothetical protein
VGVSNVVGLHLSRQLAWRLEHQSIIKHLYLNFCSLDVIRSVAT